MLKKTLVGLCASAALLLGASRVDSGILYFSSQETSDSIPVTKVKEEVDLGSIISRVKEKYPNKHLEYFSRGFLQFQEGKFIQDNEIDKSIKDLDIENGKRDSDYKIDGANFNADSLFMIDPDPHHIGDDKKSWLPIQKPEGLAYEKKFVLNNLESMNHPRLGIEVLLPNAENPVYINGQQVGFLPRIPKKEWSSLLQEYKSKTPFLYGEIPIAKYLTPGENTVRIQSVSSGGLFSKNYNNFMIRRIQIVYNRGDENNGDRK
jgi:hypothetical protein